MFDIVAVEEAKKHAWSQFPNESCGLIINNKYVPCRNISDIPHEDFIVDPNDYYKFKAGNIPIQAVVHSHTNGRDYPSKLDMSRQMEMKIPWGIISVDKNKASEPFWFGDQVPIPPFQKRPFRHGVTDCYALARDWFWGEHNIRLPNYARSHEWWLNGEDMFTKLFIDAGFYEIHKPQKLGDILIGKIMGKVPNHCAVYLGNGLILHHLSNRLSNIEPVERWMKFVILVLRHKEMENA